MSVGFFDFNRDRGSNLDPSVPKDPELEELIAELIFTAPENYKAFEKLVHETEFLAHQASNGEAATYSCRISILADTDYSKLFSVSRGPIDTYEYNLAARLIVSLNELAESSLDPMARDKFFSVATQGVLFSENVRVKSGHFDPLPTDIMEHTLGANLELGGVRLHLESEFRPDGKPYLEPQPDPYQGMSLEEIEAELAEEFRVA